MPRLILIRHSTPTIDPAVTSTAWDLSPEGEWAAEVLAEALGEFSPAAVWSSPERKARGTANPIADQLGVPIFIEDDLREHERASVGFLRAAEFEGGIAHLLASPHKLVFGEETADAVFDRFTAAVERASRASPGADVLAVTHGTAMSIYVSRILGLDPLAFWRGLETPMAVIISDAEMRIVSIAGAVAR